jgi:hypothetical protein
MMKKIFGMFVCTLLIAGIGYAMIGRGQPLTYDVGVQSIDYPLFYLSSYTQPVQVTVKNYGTSSAASFMTEVKIDDGTNVFYDESVVVAYLPPGATNTLSFPDVSFSPPSVCRYHVTACTHLSGDANPANDCVTKTVYVDLTPPLKFFLRIGPFYIVFVRDDCSGLNHIDWTRNGNPWLPVQIVSGAGVWRCGIRFWLGSGPVTATVYDNCGNFA